MSSEVTAARDTPIGPSLIDPSLKSNEAEGTTGSLNDLIRPQWLQFAWPIGKFVAEEVAIYCLGCQWKCCMLDHIPPN
uniref:HT n=2 Tax=Solanum tuberosum TaxID=4113 RepID=M1BIR0_SOLTU